MGPSWQRGQFSRDKDTATTEQRSEKAQGGVGRDGVQLSQLRYAMHMYLNYQ